MEPILITLPQSVTHDQIKRIQKELSPYKGKKFEGATIVIDFRNVKSLDSAGALFLHRVKDAFKKKKIQLQWINTAPEIEKTLNLFSPVKSSEPSVPSKNIFETIGEWGYEGLMHFVQSLFLFSNIGFWALVGLVKPSMRRKGEVSNQGVLIGVNALPIVALIAFLIGFILALQSAAQLRQFGANIYVADLIAIAMVSEMGPLITAILVAGRSGSAITAEIATMKVSEEIDALTVMGVDPIPYLIVPKLYALIITLPLLTVFANVIGIFGGAVIGVTYLDISFYPFFKEVFSVLRYKEIVTGMVKSLSFSVIILLTATYFGFRVKGGAEGVGRVTTASVVASIFFVIVADSILGLIFYFGEPAF
ncbi:ABC transporter permease [Calditrichota bacterium LG25]